jgi:hypothetical protein
VLDSAIGSLYSQDYNFDGDPNWTSSTKTYSYYGTQAQCNTILQTLRTLPLRDGTGSAVVHFTLFREGVTDPIADNYFNLTATATTPVTGGSGTGTIPEDGNAVPITDASFYPFYTDSFSVVLRTQRSGSNVTDAAFFNYDSNGLWIPLGKTNSSGMNFGNIAGLYQNFTSSIGSTDFLYKLSTIAYPTITLYPDSTVGFDVVTQLNTGGTFDGNSFVGGTTYTATKTMTITPSDEYSLTTAYNYSEDTVVGPIAFEITDTDANVVSYSIGFNQLSPTVSSAPGNFVSAVKPNTYTTPNTSGTSLTFYGAKADLNNYNIYYFPPIDYTSSITLGYNQSKVDVGNTYTQVGNVYMRNNSTYTQASNVNINLTNVYSNPDFTYPSLLIASSANVHVPLSGFTVSDTATVTNRTYTVTITDDTGLGKFYVGNTIQGNTLTISNSSMSSVNSTLASSSTYWTTPNFGATTLTYQVRRVIPDNNLIANTNQTMAMCPNLTPPSYFGQSWGGGTYVGTYTSAGGTGNYYLVATQRLSGSAGLRWSNSSNTTVPNDTSMIDGYANTLYLKGFQSGVLLEAAADWNSTLNGYYDWYLPSINELNLIASLYTTHTYQNSMLF